MDRSGAECATLEAMVRFARLWKTQEVKKRQAAQVVLAAGIGVALVGIALWIGARQEPTPALAIVGSPAGMCADSATNLAKLQELRERILVAEDSEELQRLVNEFYLLRTHTREDIQRAKSKRGRREARERLLNNIAAARQMPGAEAYAEALDAIEEKARNAKSWADILDAQNQFNPIYYALVGKSAASEGGGEGAPPESLPPAPPSFPSPPSQQPEDSGPPLSTGESSSGVAVWKGGDLGDDILPVGQCRPRRKSAAPAPRRPRGPVQVGHGTVLTDRGTILRAAHGSIFRPTSWWQRMRDVYGFNAVRLDVRFTKLRTNERDPVVGGPKQDSIANLKSKEEINRILQGLDYSVAKAREMGMYVIITNFTSCCGQYNEAVDQYFWRTIAPRYRNEPHVLYEIHNEPVGYPKWATRPWQKEMYANYVGYMERMYRLVRSLAPRTHIILWTPMYGLRDPGEDRARYLYEWVTSAKGIDYTNASVGVHAYPGYLWPGAGRDGPWYWVRKLQQEGYPVIVTEFSAFCNKPEVPYDPQAARRKWQPVFEYLERNNISWAALECYRPKDSRSPSGYRGGGNYGVGVYQSCAWPWLWPAPAE